MNSEKYKRQYFMPPEECLDWARKEYITKAPDWCSVDLRDGNQALIIPMSLDEKVEFFKYLVKVGFKEIEVGFPAASETEYTFLRTLIEQDLIPDDVTIQVLTQAREHIIKRTFEAFKKGRSVPSFMYINSTSLAQREQVFKKSKEEILKIATDGAKLLKKAGRRDRREFPVRILSGEFHRNRSGICAGSVQCGPGHLEAVSGLESHHQSSGHRSALHAARVRKPDRIYEQTHEIP